MPAFKQRHPDGGVGTQRGGRGGGGDGRYGNRGGVQGGTSVYSTKSLIIHACINMVTYHVVLNNCSTAAIGQLNKFNTTRQLLISS
ncbi:unnamed protein product [Schistosoma mattheei]|uniref:Uncharacterized protein n=1 Tax=Schistosoma mattheei TaxID=31246 RepID=A0A183Q019_9TREM|nr:unnamed protein product [Schistosoma mattheei]